MTTGLLADSYNDVIERFAPGRYVLVPSQTGTLWDSQRVYP